jgi:hypothetical protein
MIQLAPVTLFIFIFIFSGLFSVRHTNLHCSFDLLLSSRVKKLEIAMSVNHGGHPFLSQVYRARAATRTRPMTAIPLSGRAALLALFVGAVVGDVEEPPFADDGEEPPPAEVGDELPLPVDVGPVEMTVVGTDRDPSIEETVQW